MRTLPNVIVFSVNLIVPEGLDTPNNMYYCKTLSFFVNLIVPEGFLHFTYLVFTVVMLPSSEVWAVAHIIYCILPTGDLGLVWASDIVVVAHYS